MNDETINKLKVELIKAKQRKEGKKTEYYQRFYEGFIDGLDYALFLLGE